MGRITTAPIRYPVGHRYAIAAVWVAGAVIASVPSATTFGRNLLPSTVDAAGPPGVSGLLYAYNRHNPRPAPQGPPAPTPKPHRPLRRPPEALANRRHHRSASSLLSDQVVLALAGLVILSVGACWLTWLFGLSSAVLPLALGIVAGPATGLVSPDTLFGNLTLPLVVISLAVILFEEGLLVRTTERRRLSRVVANATGIGWLLTWAICAGAAYLLLHLEAPLAGFFGVVLAITGPPMQPQRGHSTYGTILQHEGILLDLLGTALVVLLFQALLFGSTSYPQDAPAVLINTFWIGGVAGLLGALLLGTLIMSAALPDFLRRPVALTMVIATVTAANFFQADAGLLAAIVMGVALGNHQGASSRLATSRGDNLHALLGAALLVLLSARLEFIGFAQAGWAAALFLAVVILIARPAAVTLSTLRTGWNWRERVWVAWTAPRGVVAAALATLFALRLADAGFPAAAHLVPLTLLVLLGTAALCEVTALAARLGTLGAPMANTAAVGSAPVPPPPGIRVS